MLKRIWENWLLIAHKIGVWQSKVIMTVFYFIVAAPFAIIIKIFFDSLAIKKNNDGSFWFEHETKDALHDAQKQY